MMMIIPPEGKNGFILPAFRSLCEHLSEQPNWIPAAGYFGKCYSHIFKGKCRKGQNDAGMTSRLHTGCHKRKRETIRGIWTLSLIITFRREGKYLHANLSNHTSI